MKHSPTTTDATAAIRHALLRQVDRLAGDEPSLLVVTPRRSATSDGVFVAVTAIPHTSGNLELILGTPAGSPDRLRRLGFAPAPRSGEDTTNPEPSDASYVHDAEITDVGAPTRIARRIVAVLRYVHGLPRHDGVSIESRRLDGAGPERDGDPLRRAIEDFALRPSDPEAVRRLALTLDCSVFFVPTAAVSDGALTEAGPNPILISSGAEQTTAIPVYTQRPRGIDGAELTVVGCRDMLGWAEETGCGPLLVDPNGPAPIVLEPTTIRVLREAHADEH